MRLSRVVMLTAFLVSLGWGLWVLDRGGLNWAQSPRDRVEPGLSLEKGPRSLEPSETSSRALDSRVGEETSGGGQALDEAASEERESDDEPLRHEEALERREAMESYPGSFEAAVANGNLRLATDILMGQVTQGSQMAQDVYDTLREPMGQHSFLWRDRGLMMTYFGSCVELKCDQKSWWALARSMEPSTVQAMEGCLLVWGDLLPVLAGRRPEMEEDRDRFGQNMEHCVQHNSIQDPTVRNIVQTWLSVERLAGKANRGRQAYEALRSKVTTLPDVQSLVPGYP